MKPLLRADIAAILAIGAGAFVSGLLTAVMLSSTPDRNTRLTVRFEKEPYVQVDVDFEGSHSDWFPEGYEAKPTIHLESKSSRVTFPRDK